MRSIAESAKKASRTLRTMGREEKDRALLAMAAALRANRAEIEAANARDLEADLPAAKKERLKIDVEAVASSIESIVHPMPSGPRWARASARIASMSPRRAEPEAVWKVQACWRVVRSTSAPDSWSKRSS